MIDKFILPDNLRGRGLHTNVIPTVCNLETMLNKLVDLNGEDSKLKQWEKRSYKAYKINDIKFDILNSPASEWRCIIRENILQSHPDELGPSCIDIYLVAYVAEEYGIGKETFFEYVKRTGISEKTNSAQAIWQVGKGDGVFLGILNNNGTVKDWSFIKRWLSRPI
ncbi:MAG: hypothetical protein Q7J85_09545 [Bacillota bacterium]|nr:hypothetical protein [Bacillota bacterium]